MRLILDMDFPVTLVYLAVQVKQGNAALASSRHHEMLDLILKNAFSPISENREFAKFIASAQENPESLDEIDWLRFVYYATGTFAEVSRLHRRKDISGCVSPCNRRLTIAEPASSQCAFPMGRISHISKAHGNGPVIPTLGR